LKKDLEILKMAFSENSFILVKCKMAKWAGYKIANSANPNAARAAPG